MAKKHLSPALFLAISMGLVSAFGMVGCSHSAGTSDSDVPPADAGTDAVPQAAVDGSNPNDPNAAPPTAAAPDGTPPAPTADAGAPPPPPADATASAGSPPPAPDAPPAAPVAPPVDTASAPPAAAAAPTAPTPPADTAAAAPAPAAPAPSVATNSNNSSGGVGPQDYTVQKGDTLMKIAFQTYGDLYKWHDIYQANQDRIKNPNDVPPGTVLKIDQPSVPVSIERNGDQYLIKVGDTLGTISTDVYGTKTKWKKLYENNKQLIKDPNKIYAGFYLFYTLTPEERQQLEQRGGPGKPLAESDSTSEPQAAADPGQDAGAAQAPQAAAPQQGAPQAAAPQADSRMPSSVPPAPAQQVAKAPTQPGAPSDDLNQVAQQH